MNTPHIKIILSGNYHKPHLVMQIGNVQTRMHSEQYSTRSNAKRALRTLVKVLDTVEYPIIEIDETRKPTV